jgi:hypothetical protein
VAELDVYDIAFLAGGPARVVDAALVALVEAGRVRVHSPGELAVAELARRHPVEAAVLDAVGPQGHRSVETIRWRLTDDERLLDLGRRLSADGLLRGRRVRRRGDVSPWTTTHAGQRMLRRMTSTPPPDTVAGGTSALRVALHGREALPDSALRAAIFERPSPLPVVGVADTLRRRRDAEHLDPVRAAYDSRGVLGGGAAIGGFGDGGGGGF